ncbi:MAG: hypothetical protein ACP5Q5_00815 [Brevinematia bacterium]
MKKIIISIVLVSSFLPFGWTSDIDTLRGEKDSFLSTLNSTIQASIPSILTVKKNGSIYLQSEENLSFSFNISYSEVNSSLFDTFDNNFTLLDYRRLFEMPCLKWPLISGNFILMFPSRWLLTTYVKGWMGSENISPTTLGAGGSILYELTEENSIYIGVKTGLGYNYWTGNYSKSREISIDGNQYNAKFGFDGSYHGPSVEVIFEKSFFFLNSYARLNYTYMWGKMDSFLEVENLIEKTVNSSSKEIQGLVLSGGIEIMLALLNINLEFGMNVLSSSVYVDAGVRIGL